MRMLSLVVILAALTADQVPAQAQIFQRDLQSPLAGPRQTVGYRGIVVSSAVPGSEPAAGQLRAYPLVQGPMAVAGVPGDPSAVYVPPYSPDVTWLGPSQHVAGYAGWSAPQQRRLFPSPPGGSGLPLVTDGGFNYGPAAAVVNRALPPPYAGYYGTVAPVYACPPGTTPATTVPVAP